MALLPTNRTLSSTAQNHLDDHLQIHPKLNDIPNVVRDYGADNTGATDASTAIQTAIDAMSTSGGMLFFPTGVYDIGTVLNLSSKANVHLLGVGAAMHNEGTGYGSVLRSRTNAMTVMQVDSGSLIHQGPTIEGINFRAKTGHTGVTLLKLKAVNRWRVARCGFRSEDADQNTGLVIDGAATDNSWWTIEQPLFSNLLTGLQCTGFVAGGTIVGGAFAQASASTTAVGMSINGSNIKVYGTKFDNGIPIVLLAANHCDFMGLTIEGPPSGVYAIDVGTTGAARRNRFWVSVGGKGLGGSGIRFNTTNALDNYYVLATENLGGAGVPVTDNGSRNVGVVMDGGAARVRLQHVGAGTPTGGLSGDMAVGNSKIWVNDAGTWKSVTVA